MLPFDNLSDDAEQGYLADGITEDLTTELARIPGLFVISRNAAFTYKGKGVPPAEVATRARRPLPPGRQHPPRRRRMRINAQLIDAETGGHIWAERFDGAVGRRLRAAGPGRREHRGRAQASTGLGPARGQCRRHEKSLRLRRLPSRPRSLPPRHVRGYGQGGRSLQRRHYR